jgi:hypothetical protein
MTTSCGSPVLIATARAKRNCAAISFAEECSCMPRMPPPNAAIASRLAAAMITSTTSISSSVNPAERPRVRIPSVPAPAPAALIGT